MEKVGEGVDRWSTRLTGRETALGRAAWAIWFVLVLWVACFDPFGLDMRAESITEATVQRLFAPRYPVAASRHIVLVQPRLADLDRPAGLAVPLTLSTHAQIVRALTAAGARAVFIDSSFRNPPDPDPDPFAALVVRAGPRPTGADALAAAIGEARRAGIAVLTGPVGRRADLAPLARAAQQTGVVLEADHPADYPLRQQGVATAAADLYGAVCSGHDPLPGCSADLLATLAGDPAPMALRFGSGYPDGQHLFDGEAAAARCSGRSELAVLRTELVGGDPGLPCHQHLSIPAATLLQAENQFARLAAMIRGRVVMVGVAGQMGDDHVVPGVGNIPGVTIHATALDNLLTWGAHYPRWPANFVAGIQIGWDEVLKLIALLVLPQVLAGFARQLGRAELTRDECRRRTAIMAIAVAVLLVLPAVAGALFASWPLSVAVVLAGMATVVSEGLSGARFRRAIRGYTGPVAAVSMLAAAMLVLLFLAWPEALVPVLVPVLALAAAAGVLAALRRIRPPTPQSVPDPEHAA